jgi:hypothetical protein
MAAIDGRDELKQHVLATYLTLRIGMGIIAAALPLALVLAGLFAGLGIQGSMSAYYWAGAQPNPPGRVWFVGGLFAIAAFLYLYKGYTKRENVALNFAALFAIGVAYFPMEVNCLPNDTPADPKLFSYCFEGWNPHGAAAVAVFACLAYVVFFRAWDTLGEMPTSKLRNRFKALYVLCATAMVAAPAVAGFMHVVRDNYSTVTFWLEATGVFAFAAFWLVKSVEMRISSAEQKAAAGQGVRPPPPEPPKDSVGGLVQPTEGQA